MSFGPVRRRVTMLQVRGRDGHGSAPDHPWVVLADPEDNEFCVLPAR